MWRCWRAHGRTSTSTAWRRRSRTWRPPPCCMCSPSRQKAGPARCSLRAGPVSPAPELFSKMKMQMKVVTDRYRLAPALVLAALVSLALLIPIAAKAQAQLSAEEARLIEFGKEIFKSKAVCQYCHKWDASGDQGYGGNALSLPTNPPTPH